MPCDAVVRPQQTAAERAAEVRARTEQLAKMLIQRRVKAIVGPQGAITFQGWGEADRAGITDACAYRRLMVMGSALARAEIARAEQMAGRTVDKKVVAAGTHSHDGGQTWHAKD